MVDGHFAIYSYKCRNLDLFRPTNNPIDSVVPSNRWLNIPYKEDSKCMMIEQIKSWFECVLRSFAFYIVYYIELPFLRWNIYIFRWVLNTKVTFHFFIIFSLKNSVAIEMTTVHMRLCIVPEISLYWIFQVNVISLKPKFNSSYFQCVDPSS